MYSRVTLDKRIFFDFYIILYYMFHGTYKLTVGILRLVLKVYTE